MMGKSGRAMLDALVSGTTDPGVLADLARGRLRKKLPALRAALEGRFDAEHVLVVGRILAHIDYLEEAIDDLSAAIEEQLGPFAPAVELLVHDPRRRAPRRRGDHRRDRRRHERLPDRQAPGLLGRHVPRQRRVRRQTTNGQDAQGLQMAQPDAGRVRQERQPQQEHLPRRPIRRLRARRGPNKATIAVCHSILTAVWHMLSTGETYTDPGGDFFTRRDPERTRKRLIGQLERLGYTVTLQEGAAPAQA